MGRRYHFNSRPHAGGDRRQRRDHANRRISIPAPTRGATTVKFQVMKVQYLFQFPPPRGGRLCRPGRYRAAGHFNSRPHAGGDVLSGNPEHPNLISIPAPTRGATAKIDKKACGFCCKFTMFALRSFEKQEQFSRKSLLSPKQQMIFLTFTAPIARCLVYGWHWRRKTCGYRSKGSPDWIGAVFPSVSILFLKELPSL